MIQWNQKDKQAPKHNWGWTPWTSQFKSLFFPPSKIPRRLNFGNQKDQWHFIHALFSIPPLSRQHMTPALCKPSSSSGFASKAQEKTSHELQEEQVWTLQALNQSSETWQIYSQDNCGFLRFSTQNTLQQLSLKSLFASTLEKVH